MANLAVERRAGNLPAEMTRFIGRSSEIAKVGRLLELSRLVTVAGPGGVGKTRLALRVAADQRKTFTDGVWFVELSALREVDLLAHAVAEVLQLPDQSARDRLDVLADHLEDKHLLLVLDTCEHLVDACAMLAEVLLRAASRLHILVTSREPLDVMGEHVLTLAPLAVPAPGDPAAEAAASEAVQLFADRAAAILPNFALGEAELDKVGALCRRLDGIPLAIELAAVRLRALSLDQIIARLDDRFRLLGTTRESRNRHQTLRAAVAWSYDLCTADEQRLWARLSVFPGGFDLAAAEHICGHDGLPVLETLARLVEKSVVVHDGADRYRMLDTLAEFGRECLGDDAELRNRHRDWYARLADQIAAATMSEGQPVRFQVLRLEHANLRAALDHAVQTAKTADDVAAAQFMTVALTHFWFSGGRFGEGRHWVERVLELPDDETGTTRTLALCSAGLFSGMQGDLRAAERYREEAVALAATLGDPYGMLHAQRLSGLVAFLNNDFDSARELLNGTRQPGETDPWGVLTLPLLGAAYCLSGLMEEAIICAEECLEISEACGDLWCRSYATWVRALAHCLMGELEAAVADARECLRLMERLHDRLGGAMAVDLLAGCAYFARDPQRAARLFGAANRMWRTLGAPMFFGRAYLTLRDFICGEAQAVLGEKQWLALHDEGGRMSLDETVALALAERVRPAAVRGVAASDPWYPLTRREREIAELVAEGLSNREIAERLVIAKRTADSHLEHILAKLGFSSRAQVAAWTMSRRAG